MARFYASIQGNRGEATRMGTANSGAYGHIRGWAVGGRVDMDADSNDCDVATLTATGGSNGGSNIEIAEVRGNQDITLADNSFMRAAARRLLADELT